MLTGKQKRFLRKEAHHLSPIFQVGKQGVNDNLIAQLNDVLEKRELIKIKKRSPNRLCGEQMLSWCRSLGISLFCTSLLKKINRLNYHNA